MEEEERSRQPSTTADRTIGPLVEHGQLGAIALFGDSGNCDRPFYTRASGDVIEISEDGTVATLERPAELPEGETALCV